MDNITYETINGRQCERMLWSDIKAKYPDRWVVYTNSVDVKGDFICTILELCNSDNYESIVFKYYEAGLIVGFGYTTECNILAGYY